ncbi:MAG: hypothetical protein Ta2A_13310 [Treponemataceae bacterium]|nr:MAG: hypothetical protein Ta2A_13310 [Treponemataceae bacterium]
MAMSMTDEEAEALDKEFTNGSLKLGEGTCPIMRSRELLRGLDEVSYNYIITSAEAAHTTPAHIIGDMVREKIAASA